MEKIGSASVYIGDCLESLRSMPDKSVHCCVTSPPYWGLRDYRADGQLGLEKTPEEYVAKMVEVFREVRRVLRDDGTLWLNLGDSYATNTGGGGPSEKQTSNAGAWTTGRRSNVVGALKPKDLVGIPWRVAFALQQPFYAGSIGRVEDRAWLAAMLDAEGCMFIHKRKAGQNNGQGYERKNDSFSPGVEISNTSLSIIERIHKLVGKGSVCSQSPDENNRRKQTIYRWNLRTNECRDFVRELYPHLVGKQQQARILCGCPSSGERAEAAHAALMALHRTGVSDVDFPAPPSMFEPGYYLRQDVIWSKSNPMPESVTDRCTKSHEYVFLLSKSARYFYDAEAVKEPFADDRMGNPGGGGQYSVGSGRNDHGALKTGRWNEDGAATGRNRRSVWHISTRSYKGAHFATFPTTLVEPCVKAGTSEYGACAECGSPWSRIVSKVRRATRPGADTKVSQAEGGLGVEDRSLVIGNRDPQRHVTETKTEGWGKTCKCATTENRPCIVLDPFGGSGTTGRVASDLGRDSILCELNADYVELIRKRMTEPSKPVKKKRQSAVSHLPTTS